MTIRIVVPVAETVEEEDVTRVCEHHNCICKKIAGNQYIIETDDALNLFWLGMNFNAQL